MVRPALIPLLCLLAFPSLAHPSPTPFTTTPTTATTPSTTPATPAMTRPATRPAGDAVQQLGTGLATCLLFVLGGTLFLIVLGVALSTIRRRRE